MPIDDSDKESFEKSLVEAAIKLHYLIKTKDLSTFVHCTTGYNRAPAVVLTYFCLFMEHPDWKDVDKVAEWLKSEYSASFPNLDLVKRVVENNRYLTE